VKELSIIQLVLPNNLLVLQRRDENTKISPGLLGFFGGHIEDSEMPLEAMKRELSEETSIDVSSLKLKYVISKDIAHPNNPKIINKRVHLFKAKIHNDEFDVYEGQRAESYSAEDLKKRQDLAPTARYIVDNFVGKRKLQ